ncbi:MAG: hypothetical protein KU28_00335 [Sulfurovum sp. PC08-66]|nr:MAG: hypothetical protein KU28_00335 [Sulfurovum sp. PC08-66]KIM12418.1 MAG: hypothetical protein KU37_00455 [Sulfuricurvum sp. PC08-66]
MRVAIVRLGAMGDIIHTVFALQHLKAAHPQMRIDWVCESVWAPLLQSCDAIDTVHPIALKTLKKNFSFGSLLALIKQLRSWGPYDVVIDAQGLLKSAIVARFLGGNRWGFSRKSLREPLAALFYTHHVSIDYAQNVLLRNATLLSTALQTPITPHAIAQKTPLFYTSLKPYLFDAIICVVGTSQPYKNYPVNAWIEAIEALQEKVLLVWGTSQEERDAQTIADATPLANVAPKLTLEELVALVSHARLVIGGDTGPTYLAWALNRPSITLFGATSARRSMWTTSMNVALESSSAVDDARTDKRDFSIATIEALDIAHTARRLLETQN